MIYLVMGWFEIAQYNYKKMMTIITLIETNWLFRYSRPKETMYHRGYEIIGHELKNNPIKH